MRESVTYQAILREGRQEGRFEGLQEALLLQGRKKFGEPDPIVRTALTAIRDYERLDALTVRMLDAESWAELLAQ